MRAALYTLAFLFFAAALRSGYQVPWRDYPQVSQTQILVFALLSIAGISALGFGAIVDRLDRRR